MRAIKNVKKKSPKRTYPIGLAVTFLSVKVFIIFSMWILLPFFYYMVKNYINLANFLVYKKFEILIFSDFSLILKNRQQWAYPKILYRPYKELI